MRIILIVIGKALSMFLLLYAEAENMLFKVASAIDTREVRKNTKTMAKPISKNIKEIFAKDGEVYVEN